MTGLFEVLAVKNLVGTAEAENKLGSYKLELLMPAMSAG